MGPGSAPNGSAPAARRRLRNWKPGDRVRLRYSSGPRKVKEVLERLRVTGTEPGGLAGAGSGWRIVWMRAWKLEPEPGAIVVVATVLWSRISPRQCPPGMETNARETATPRILRFS
jgi:hypothetical protein